MSGIYILYLEGEIVGFSDAPRELDENLDKVVGPIPLELVASVYDLLDILGFAEMQIQSVLNSQYTTLTPGEAGVFQEVLHRIRTAKGEQT